MSRRLLAASAALALVGCGGAEAPARPSLLRPSVVLVLVDQLRADALERWMPETRALAERGVRFEEMRAVAPWTYPSVISLLSGLYPQQHGADGSEDGKRMTVFSEAVPLLPRILGAAGYHTAGFVTNPFLHEWNPVHEAFEHYDASFIGNQGATRGHGQVVWTERMWADSVNPAVSAWFDGRALDGPEFVYVHYIDVHGRKEGPERWQGAPFEPSYEGAVRCVDARIRELHAYFSERYHGELLFVVTSDHGQDLDDDVKVGQGPGWRQRKASLHDFNLRIPMVVLPGRPVPEGRVVAGPCANVDVTPTLLDWLGLPPLEDAPGASLLGAIRGEPYDGGARELYARNSAFGRLEEALVHDARKLVRYTQPMRARSLFDLRADPREERPLTAIRAEDEARLEAAAAQRLVFPVELGEPAPGLREDLDKLGYGGSEEAPEGKPK
jgi:arylsulfatase A-like enzyme